MTIRNSGSRRSNSSAKPSHSRDRNHQRRRELGRRVLLEALERRQLMAVGPQLAGIQPNEGALLFDGVTLTTAPRELVFRFDDSTSINPETLSGIRITRAGADGVFEAATATTDFGTMGGVQVEFRSLLPGASGNGQQILLTSANRSGTSLPMIRDVGGVIEIELNSNPLRTTRVQDLLTAFAASPVASRAEVILVSGPSLTAIGGTVVSGSRLTLQGANSAQALTDLGVGSGTLVRMLAVNPGPEGRGIQIAISKRDFGGPANPVVTVQGNRIGIQINSSVGAVSTIGQLLTAINSNPEASQLVRAVLETGSLATSLAAMPNNFAPLLLAGAGDVVLTPGYVGLGDSAREVVFRFNENLPDDKYRIDILGSGSSRLTNVLGQPFNGGVDLGVNFELNLGPRVMAVVPEPVKRSANGQLSQAAGTIDVHFNDDDLSPAAAQNVNHYQLVFKGSNGSDVVLRPQSALYDPLTNIATLRFGSSLSRLVDPTSATGEFLTGAFRLRVGTSEGLPAAPVLVNPGTEPGDSFGSAFNLGANLGSLAGGTRSLIVNGSIENQSNFEFELPGGQGTQGRRQVRPEDISRLIGPLPLDYFRLDADGDLQGDPDREPGITEFVYAFPAEYRGPDAATGGATQKTYSNVITEEQKQRVREVMALFSEYLGISFIERLNSGADPRDNVTMIVVGDLYSANGDAISGQGGANDIVAAFRPDGVDTNVFPDLGVLDFQNFDEADDDRFGGEFTRGAMLLVGQLLGYGYGDDLPQPVSQSSTFVLNPGSDAEATFPSIADILHGQFLYRPESSDIDLYSFDLSEPGRLTAETFAERMDSVSLLDTTLRLYRRDAVSGRYVEIAANDNYNSVDSLIDLQLPAGSYALGISASGNQTYDPVISGTGFGGRSEGEYQLRLTVRPDRPQGLVDTTGVALDGDGDGRPGGVFDFWYRAAEPLNPALRQLELAVPNGPITSATIFVDKAATSNGTGALTAPLRSIDQAIAMARPGDVIRIVANGGADGRISTPEDNLSYQIGVDSLGRTLADGRSIEVPKGVTMVVDAGAVLKFRNSHITVGSNAPTVDRSGSALMVLGTPVLVEANGLVAVDSLREPIPGSVYFTSYNDASIGVGNSPRNLTVQSGDWGGIDFRGELDSADENRMNLEKQGIFLNQIYGANIRYGGGQVSVVGRPTAISAIEIDILRPTIAYSRISNSSGAAIEATPDSFLETSFFEYVAPGETGFTPDFSRVGPDIHNNLLIDNSINGMQIRIATRTGEGVTTLKGQARFDDTDIVHVLTENLIVEGTPGGPVIESLIPPSLLVRTAATAGGFLAPATYVYRISYVDASGNETPASNPTVPLTTTAVGGVALSQLPVVPLNSPFTARRLYRATVNAAGVVGDYRLAATLNGSSTSFTDNGSMSGSLLVDRPVQLRSRPDARLSIDGGTVVKLDGARIETTFGGNLIAEGTVGNPVVFTSLSDGRYGAGGAFKTDSKSDVTTLTPGDWGGIYVGYASSASLDHARIAGAGGVTRIEGGFASFNPIEVHQATFRMANSRLELNAGGDAQSHPDRAGRSTNERGTLFVRGASPTIVDNVFVDGSGPAITIDVNSMGFAEQGDVGRSTGQIGRVDIRGNSGPLIRGNALDRNDLNGLHVRGGNTTTEIVFDDTDIAHIVLDTITIPNQHIFGGMRLQSSPEASLVVKFESRANEVAGIVVGGSLLTSVNQLGAVSDRIGGSLQLVGSPDFPVVLTALADDSVGAGFTPDGRAQVDTNNDGLFGAEQSTVLGFAQLPFGPEVNNGLNIDNDVSRNVPGFFRATPEAGGGIGPSTGVTVNSLGSILIDQDYIFDFLNMVDVGSNGDGVSLATTTITQPPTLVADDRVQSRGSFVGQNGLVNWTVDTYFLDGVPVLFNSVKFESSTTLGNLRLVNYLDEDVELQTDDILFTTGTPGQADFRAFTVDGNRRIGFSQGGYYTEDGTNLQNATYVGWAADTYRDLLDDIEGGGTQYTVPGNINLANLPLRTDAQFGTIYGPGDVTTAFAWNVNPDAFSATVTSFLELIPQDPASASAAVQSGLWQGVTIREGASDRNVVWSPENESTIENSDRGNSIPGTAQFLGELAGESRGGDENQRLGFVIDGNIATRSDVDVYAFVGRAGSEVWLDIDRTAMTLDSVVELIDANGNVLASSDDSAAESLDPTKLFRNPVVNASSINPMNSLELGQQTLAAAQDRFSNNPKDAGFRMVLPGDEGSRNLYHVRVRSSNAEGGDRVPDGPNSPLVRAGLTMGGYRLQVRLREADESPGTQVRLGDVRYGRTNLQIIGQPFHSPLLGEKQETAAANNLRVNAQPLGPFALAVDAQNPGAANLAASDRTSLSVGGDISSATDVDWYTFNINYQRLPAGTVSQYLSTVFDLDYADGFARADMSLYVFDASGRLVLMGLDSNVSEDQPRPGQGTDASDLSRGSAGTGDPFIGSAELQSGTYFVAVTNNTQVPRVINPFFTGTGDTNISIVDPNLRLEPLSSIRRIAEDHIGAGQQTAAVPGSPNGPQLLFTADSFVPFTLDDMVMYSLLTGPAGDQPALTMNNPFNGADYGLVGAQGGLAGFSIRDIAVHPNGELFGFTYRDFDLGTRFVRISSEDGAFTDVGPLGVRTVLDTNLLGVGIRVQALALQPGANGIVVGHRGTGTIDTPTVYDRNIVYRFDSTTGLATSLPASDRTVLNNGARTDIVERGFIDTDARVGGLNTFDFSDATFVSVNGQSTFQILDGMGFSFRSSEGTVRRIELNSGPDYRFAYNADAGISVRDGDQYTVNGVVYEFETGGAIELRPGSIVVDGATIRITNSAGLATTFELTSDANVASGNVAVNYTSTMTAGAIATQLANAITAANIGVVPDVLGTTGRIGLTGESTTAPPVTTGTGISYAGATGLVSATAIPIVLEEGVSYQTFIGQIVAATQGPVAVGVAGDRVNFRGAEAANNFQTLISRGIIVANPNSINGSYGDGIVSAGATGVDFLASDSAEVIATRIANAINSSAFGTTTATVNGRSVTLTNATVNAAAVDAFSFGGIRLQNLAPGGDVSGLALREGRLFAVSENGGFYVVDNPLVGNSERADSGIAPGPIGQYIATATDLLGINFTSLANGPNLNYVDTWTSPGTSVVRSMGQLFFGADRAGFLYAFNDQGVLQPVFEGGATRIWTGRGNTDGIILSTLDSNLWHVSGRRGDDPGHGVNADPFGTRGATPGGNSLYFGSTQTRRPRLDGQPQLGSYNFPGGASGALETQEFSLAGYAAADQPHLYFNYLLSTDGVDGLGGDQDSLHVYVLTPDGRATLVATNNLATGGGLNDDPLDPVDGAAVRPLFDNAGWRQARVPLGAFAGQTGLKLRVEFASAGQMSNGALQIRTGNGDQYQDGQVLTIAGRAIELDYGPMLTLTNGLGFAEFYSAADGGVAGSQPGARITVNAGGITFVLTDGLRTVAAGEVPVLLAIADDPLTPADESKSLAELTATEIAGLLRAAILANQPAPTTMPGTVDLSIEPNDELARATRLERAIGDTIIRGQGRIGTAAGTQLNDVDLSRVRLLAGETITIDVQRTSGSIRPQIRVFDAAGRELARTTGNGTGAQLSYTATEEIELFIGINSASDYNPNLAGSAVSLTGGGTYTAEIRTTSRFDVIQVGNRLQLLGVEQASSNNTSLVRVQGELGVAATSMRLPLTIDMSAAQVAAALQRLLVREYSNGVQSAFPLYSNSIEIGNLAVDDIGPFNVLGGGRGDLFGSLGPGRARANTGEGVYLDDFVIGFAERGEMVTGASLIAGADLFATSQEQNLTNPPAPSARLVTGAYQLEIRDGSEYVRYQFPTDRPPFPEYFRTFDTNDRLVSGAVTLVAPAANELIDGMTFTISDSVRQLTFEFDMIGSTAGVTNGHVRIPFDGNTISEGSADQVAQAIVAAINSPSVQSLLKVTAGLTLGANGSPAGPVVQLFGSVVVTDNSGRLQIVQSAGRGDANRELDDQGVIIIESSRFSFASEFGIDLNHGATSTNDDTTTNNLMRYPRNLVELNVGGQVPGVVVQSNVIAYNGQGAIRINGLADTSATINPVPVDRIVNNTLVGGRINPGVTTPAATYQGLLFRQGNVSFADAVVNYTPLAGGGPAPEAQFQNVNNALGAPNAANLGSEPTDNLGTVSLGYGGSITVQFTDNFLTGDGTAAPDLVVFEVGAIESVRVEVSRDGNIFTPVGTVGGLTNRIDIDAFGFTPQDRLSFVRLTDLRQGDRNSLSVGADIDAVGALSTVPADIYLPGGIGVNVQRNAAPTIINNVVANFVTGVTADPTSGQTVSGANTFYRNSSNISGTAQLGQASQVLNSAINVFVSPTEMVFDPASGSPLVDSSIDSLADRPTMATVRGSIGLEPSPVLAPRLDVNGQLRVDDPNVDSPSGVGENVFKDRGASDRADQAGPVGRLVTPPDNDAAGTDINPAINVVSFFGSTTAAFEIQLIDGIGPADPTPGVGIADGSVSSSSLLLFRDNQVLVEGVDYRFAYQPASNTIRLTPLAGVWESDSVYTIRLLDRNDSVFVATDGDQYVDGATLNVIDEQGRLLVLEVETGLTLGVPALNGNPVITDGTTFSLFDGARTVVFEIDTNNASLPGRVRVPLRTNMLLAEVSAAYATAINGAAMGLTAVASDGALVQLVGMNPRSSADPLDSGVVVRGQVGVSTGYGLQIPVSPGTLVPNGLVDGQTFAIRRGPFQVVNFEINTAGGLTNPGFVPVNYAAGSNLDAIADALVRAIGGAGIGLSPSNAGFGRVALNGDASYSVDLTNTVLEVLGAPGQIASVALPISVAPGSTADTIAIQVAAAIEAQNLAGVSTLIVGSRVIINGAQGIAGAGAQNLVTIRDRVGNLLQSNQPDGTTMFTIFLGSGFDYGDAPDPIYDSKQASGGPRHKVVPGLSIGPTVTPDADAVPNDGDVDDGVALVGAVYTGFEANFNVQVQNVLGGTYVLDYWVDWNRDGVFSAAERGGTTTGTVSGVVPITIEVPSLGTAAEGRTLYSVPGETFARFRLSSAGVNSPLGDAPDGEVEDFSFTLTINPFQNPAGRYDVNASGDVSPIDILQIVNLLNRTGSNSIALDPANPPTSAPYLDVTGDGRVTPMDALAVLNYIERTVLGRGNGEGEGRAYQMTQSGVFASAATLFGTLEVGPAASNSAAPVEDETSEGFSNGVITPGFGGASRGFSVFDSSAVIELDEVLDSLAATYPASSASSEEAEDGLSVLDSIFDELGR